MKITLKFLKSHMKSNPAWLIYARNFSPVKKTLSYNSKGKIKVEVDGETIYKGKNRKFAVKLYNKH